MRDYNNNISILVALLLYKLKDILDVNNSLHAPSVHSLYFVKCGKLMMKAVVFRN